MATAAATEVRQAGSHDGSYQHVQQASPGQRIMHGMSDLDPAMAGLVFRLPAVGETMTAGEVERWVDAARAVLILAYGERTP